MTFQSKWGWHPCDYETYLLLKKLHLAYWQALRRYALWRRWARKQPQNRVSRRRIVDAAGRKIGSQVIGPLSEPALHPLFCIRQLVVHVRHGHGQGHRVETERVCFCDYGIPEAYRRARRPMPSPDQVLPLSISLEEIRRLAHELNLQK
jgi:hypothetical protein